MEVLLKNYIEESDKRYFLEVDVQYPEKLYKLHNILSFLPERMRLKNVEKLVANLHDKTEYVTHIRNWKEPVDHRLILKKVHRVIKFNQTAWLKPYIDMNTKLRQKVKTNFEKDFFKLMNNAVFGKLFEKAYARKHENIKLVTAERRRDYLVSEPNYQTKKIFTENLLAIEMRKTRILVNKTVCLDLSILYLSKVWLCKTKRWWKCEILLYGYRQVHFPCKNRWYLQRYCRRSWKTFWYHKELGRPLPKRKNE